MRCTLLFLSLGCAPSEKRPENDPPETGGSPVIDSADTGGGADTAESGDSADSADTQTPVHEDPPELYTCETQPDPPYVLEIGALIPPSEDFAFGPDGLAYNIDAYGNLTSTDVYGTQTVLVPGVGSAAGIGFLASGDLAYVERTSATVYRLSLTGGRIALATDLRGPNGLAVGLDGTVYVSDYTADRVIRADPDGAGAEIISDRVYGPNGISFSPDGETVYVASFGGGYVYALTQDDDGQWQTRVHTHISGLDLGQTCDGLAEGDDCLLAWGGLGTCALDAFDNLECNLAARDTGACDGLAEGDPCTTTRLGVSFDSVCTLSAMDELYCPQQEAWRLDACDGRAELRRCDTADGTPGTCTKDWNRDLICVGEDELGGVTDDCDGLAAGDACVLDWVTGPLAGVCAAAGDALLCEASAPRSSGLDGIATDTCGALYLSDYTTSDVWRVSPDGGDVALAAETPSFWIPNLHFGLGVGGFHRNVVYVMDYYGTGLLEVEVGVEGRPEALMPE